MPARDRVPGPAQVFRQVHFHLCRRLERHRVHMPWPDRLAMPVQAPTCPERLGQGYP